MMALVVSSFYEVGFAREVVVHDAFLARRSWMGMIQLG